LRQQQATLQAVDRRRDLQRGKRRRGGLRERQFILVDIAERDDARQDWASVASSSRKISRAMLPALRVGRYSVACASFSGFARTSNPSTRRPSISAAIMLRRNGTDKGTLKTRIGFLIQESSYHARGARVTWSGIKRESYPCPASALRPESQIQKAPVLAGAFCLSQPVSDLFRQQARKLHGRPRAANLIDPPGKENRASFERFDFLFLRVGFFKFCNLLVEHG